MKENNKYKRGDLHLTENLIFWQYHHPFYKKTNGEVWYTPEVFKEKARIHALFTKDYKRRKPLMYVVSATIQRDKQKYKTSEEDIIDLKFIEELLAKQNNKCYWYNTELELDSLDGSRNPSKLTIDRLDSTKGYSKDNVVLTSYAANCGRGDCPVDVWGKIIKTIYNGLVLKYKD